MISENSDLEFDFFKAALNEVIPRHAPIKQRYVRANQAPFINKMIYKVIMKRSRLKNKFLNAKSEKNFFNDISVHVTLQTVYWKTVKPLYIDKVQTKFKITLIEKKLLPENS